MRCAKALLSIFMVSILVACGTDGDDTSHTAPNHTIASLTNEEYTALSDEEKYSVANKLLSTLYKGVSVKEFFDIRDGIRALTLDDGRDFISKLKTTLSTPLDNLEYYLSKVEQNHDFDSTRRPQQYPLAMLFELPLSKDYFDAWMAYRLANTILFSPALELDSVDYIDVHRVFYRLFDMIGQDRSIRDIVYEHMTSQENWRRFRSPEDNTREMMEIYLARFIDEEVPRAATACKNWYLTDDSQGYELVVDFNENTEPQYILDTWVVNCYDFYRAVADHPSLIPTITSVLVDLFFSTHSDEERKRLVETIVSTGPVTFRDLFTTILFSKEYLLHTQRPRGFEETFFNLADRIEWYAFNNFFRYLNRPPGTWSSIETLYEMKQASLAYKLGRPAEVPLDSLSFSYYHKSVRERLLTDSKLNSFNRGDGGWQVGFIEDAGHLEEEDFIHYLFLSVLSRKATQRELEVLDQVFSSRGYDKEGKEFERAMIVLDYLSRLSELYTFRAVN